MEDEAEKEDHALSSHSITTKTLWFTREYLIYFAIIFISIAWMIYACIQFSDEKHQNYVMYKHLLSPGWIPGRKADNSDAQYASFRNNLKILSLAMFFHVLIGRILRKIGGPTAIRIFSLAFSIIFLFIMNGLNLFKIVAIVSVNYLITMRIGGIKSVYMSWIWGLLILFLNDKYRGYSFSSISSLLSFLDSYQGVQSRWYVTFNFSTLRMISYTMDYYWKNNDNYQVFTRWLGIEFQKQDDHKELSEERKRIEQPLDISQYSYFNYLIYMTYIPLYLAGPIITFNDFMSQLYKPPAQSFKSVSLYGLRWLASFLTLEFLIHFIYVIAITKTKAWIGFSPFQISLIGYFSLKHIWLKLLIIWRFFRLWALADNIITTENMHRCMSNNYSATGFWRSWHRSYNRWLIRYLYVPLGGKQYFIYNIWIVFLFVAVWHDISLKLLTWGWLVCLFILPEILARKLFPEKRFGKWKHYRHLCAFGACFNIIMMMIANLVGFAVGLEGVKFMLSEIFSFKEIGFGVGMFAYLFASSNVMFEVRNEEYRQKGVFIRY